MVQSSAKELWSHWASVGISTIIVCVFFTSELLEFLELFEVLDQAIHAWERVLLNLFSAYSAA